MAEYKSALTENNTDLQEILDAIDELPEYVDTSDATAAAGDMRSGKTAYVNGEKVTGNVPVKSSSDLTVSGAKVNVPAGIYDSAASKSVETATQATPSISVDSAGKITASATQSAGYVAAGTKSATKQLTTKAATTYTPGTSNQTIAASTYLTGVQTIKGDANLIAANILKGISIFGVSGSAVSGATIKTGTLSLGYGSLSNTGTLSIPCSFNPSFFVAFYNGTLTNSSASSRGYTMYIQNGTTYYAAYVSYNASYSGQIYSGTATALTTSSGVVTVTAPDNSIGVNYFRGSYNNGYTVPWRWFAIQ